MPKQERLAVLPIDNLSGAPAPLRELRADLVKQLAAKGVELVDENAFERFMVRHRIRYTGGIDSVMGKAIHDEEKVSTVLIINLELFIDSSPPKIALMARLVSTGSRPGILWMGNFSLAGNETPGFFGLGLIDDPNQLRSIIITRVSEAVAARLTERTTDGKSKVSSREFAPHISFSKELDEELQHPTVAVLPFFNESSRKYANEIIHLHFVQQLLASGRFKPVEPGLIREKMLSMRIIMQGGISLNQADIISNHLEADYVLAGKVFDYLDTVGPAGSPNVDFSAQMIARFSKDVVWSSKSYNTGDENVWFYDWRRVYMANPLAAGMVKSIVRRMGKSTVSRPEKPMADSKEKIEEIPYEQQFLLLP